MNNTEKKIMDAMHDYADESQVICAWNELCVARNHYEDYIYSMGEFDDFMLDVAPHEIVKMLSADFNIDDDYFCDSIYGVTSFNDIYEVVEESELIDYIISNDDDLGCSEIREVLNTNFEN